VRVNHGENPVFLMTVTILCNHQKVVLMLYQFLLYWLSPVCQHVLICTLTFFLVNSELTFHYCILYALLPSPLLMHVHSSCSPHFHSITTYILNITTPYYPARDSSPTVHQPGALPTAAPIVLLTQQPRLPSIKQKKKVSCAPF
jgi:hypothetical protein